MKRPKDLLDFKLWDNQTLRDVLTSHLADGKFGNDYLEMDEVEVENFFDTVAERIIEFIED